MIKKCFICGEDQTRKRPTSYSLDEYPVLGLPMGIYFCKDCRKDLEKAKTKWIKNARI